MKNEFSEIEVVERLKVKAEIAGSSAALARKFGVSPQYMHDVIKGNRPPGDAILRHLNLKRSVIYRRTK